MTKLKAHWSVVTVRYSSYLIRRRGLIYGVQYEYQCVSRNLFIISGDGSVRADSVRSTELELSRIGPANIDVFPSDVEVIIPR